MTIMIALQLAWLQLMGVMSPGPDFTVVCKAALVESRKNAVFVALGIGAGIAVHMTFNLLGLAILLKKSVTLFNFVQLLGAGYLLYIGTMSFISGLKGKPIEENSYDSDSTSSIKTSFTQGFLTNILNPKAALYLMALTTGSLTPAFTNFDKFLVGFEIFGITVAWFLLVALLLSRNSIRKRFLKYTHIIDLTGGIVFIAFASILIYGVFMNL